MQSLCDVFLSQSESGFFVRNALGTGVSDTETETDSDTGSEAEDIGDLTLEFTENPELSLLKYIEHIALLDPAGAYNLAKMILEDSLLGPELEKELTLKLDGLKAAMLEQQQKDPAAAFLDNGWEMTATPLPAAEQTPATLQPSILRPAFSPQQQAPGL